MPQLRCPKCGGYKIIAQDQGMEAALLWTFFAGGLMTLVGCLLLSDVSQGGGAALFWGLVLVAAGLGPLMYTHWKTQTTPHVECETCGYKWDSSSHWQ